MSTSKIAPVVQRLIRAREESGITQSQLAAMTGASLSTIASMECGGHLPSKMLIKSIIESLAANPEFIERGSEPILLPKDSIQRKLSSLVHSNIALIEQIKIDVKAQHRQKLNLPEMASCETLDAVTLQLPKLRERIKRLTEAERGKKTELVDFLSRITKRPISLSNLSRWLSTEVEPSGEIALLMERWADIEERKK